MEIELSVPLVVDLDGTLTRTDTLYESVAKLAAREPLAAASSLLVLARRGLAAFKRHVAQRCMPNPSSLPFRRELVDLVTQEKARGRGIHLVTASDQAVADAVAAQLGVFDSATGSDGVHNLKGEAKLAYVRDRFPGGFIYAGDADADLPLFRAARGVILCDVSRGTAAAVVAAGVPVVASLDARAKRIPAFLRALRMHQWSKNLLMFVPLFVGHAYGDPAKILAIALGFLALCAVASATYMINDLADLEADRHHPTKRRRPFASAELPIAVGMIAPPLMILGAFIGAYLLAPAFAATLLIYVLLTTTYSLAFKRIALFDVFVIGVLFTLRIVMGVQVIDLAQSPWLLSFALAFFLSLALAKRHGEVLRAARVDAEEIAGRGYRGDDWPITLSFGVGIGIMSILIMLLYLTNDAAPSGFYRAADWLYAIPALISLWLMRIWLLSQRLELHDDPVVFALKDRASLLLGLATAVVFWIAH